MTFNILSTYEVQNLESNILYNIMFVFIIIIINWTF